MERPNILVFMADHLQADVVRDGHPCIMPNARKLASEGVRFTQNYCVAPHCSPSRASFFTGEYPSIHGVWNNVQNMSALSRDINKGVPTFGEMLGTAGYSMGFSGKWHASAERSPADFGWQEFLCAARGYDGSAERFIENFLAGGDALPDKPGLIRRPGWGDRQYYGIRDELLRPESGAMKSVNEGNRAIEHLSKGKNPWCVFISCNPPHDPYSAPRKYLDLYDGMDVSLPPSWTDGMEDKPRIYQRMRRQYWDQLSESDAKECLRSYWALCTMVDDFLGSILQALEETGQAENTLVLFTSDHADYTGAHGLWAKGVPSFREAYAIPAVVRWPAGIANPGREVDDLLSITDFMPTFVKLATGKAPQVYGDSLLPFLEDQAPPQWRDTVFTQMNGVELYYTQRIVRTKRWKYVYNGFDFDELYNLADDPHEMVNLANPDLYDQSAATRNGRFVPWPRMTPELEAVREDLVLRMWRFAREQKDARLYTSYITTAMAPYGPRSIL